MLSVFCIVIIIAAFITKNIAIGIIMSAVLVLWLILIPIFMRKMKVKFYQDHLEIPLEYVVQGVPFSKTFISYEGLKSVEYLDKDEVDDDCVGSNGQKVSCVKFVDMMGEVYRLKLEFFSKSQAYIIIDETMRRAGLTEGNDLADEDLLL